MSAAHSQIETMLAALPWVAVDAPAGLIVSALSCRTPLERVWHGVEA